MFHSRFGVVYSTYVPLKFLILGLPSESRARATPVQLFLACSGLLTPTSVRSVCTAIVQELLAGQDILIVSGPQWYDRDRLF